MITFIRRLIWGWRLAHNRSEPIGLKDNYKED